MYQSGRKLSDDYLKVTKLVLDGGKYRLHVGMKKAIGSYKLGAKAETGAIDIKIEEGDGKGEAYLGMYKLGGDTLTICHALNGKNRPEELESTEENEAMLVV